MNTSFFGELLQTIADRAPDKVLAPAPGSAERYKLLEWLNFITSELHKNFSPLFQPVFNDEVKGFFKYRLMGKFKYVDSQLAGHDYLLGNEFTVADGYLFTILRWADGKHIDTSSLKNLTAYKARVAARPHVKAVLLAEGLIKAA